MATAGTIKCVASIIKSDKQRRFVVVSAPGKRFGTDEKVTDLLYRAKRERGGQAFDALKARFSELESELAIDVGILRELEYIKKKIQNGASEDFVASRGEYLSAKLLAALIKVPFVDTANLIRFVGDELDFEVTKNNLYNALKNLDMAVLPGFYGSDENGNIKTFSRGGSDITGALVAAAIGADVYENWTDVDGIFDKDPKKYSDAKPIARLTYAEMYRLAKAGANVLHKDAVFPVEQMGIPIRILNTFNSHFEGSLIE